MATSLILPALSYVFGWGYFIAWSLSFYPQPVLNYYRQSTSGATIDFPAINILGFAAYFISNTAFLYSPEIRRQYAARNYGLTPTVKFNDVAFAAHATICSIVSVTQYFSSIWGFEDRCRRRERIGRTVMGIFVGSIIGVGGVVAVVATHPGTDVVSGWAEIDIVYAISYVKLVVTLVKYMPQLITNYNNKSTHGWSIHQILLDLIGGFLSLAQLGIDSYIQRDWSGITGNPVKLALGNSSLLFDSMFIIQHYILYPGAGKNEHNEGRALLEAEGDDAA